MPGLDIDLEFRVRFKVLYLRPWLINFLFFFFFFCILRTSVDLDLDTFRSRIFRSLIKYAMGLICRIQEFTLESK